MRLLNLCERQKIDLGASSGLSSSDVDALAKLESALPKGLLNWGHRSLSFGPFCGVLRVNDLTIELLPKTGNADRARGVLVAMLRATNSLPSRPTKDAALRMQRVHLLDQFIEEFCSMVETALTQGPISQYVEQEENMGALRGRLALTQHLRSNLVDRSHLYCRFDERTIDNAYNRALKFVLHRLRTAAISSKAKGTVETLIHRFDQVLDAQITAQDVGALRFDRLNRRWQSIFERAGWFLRGLFPDVRAGRSEGTGLLFNMEHLFERFVGLRVRQAWEHRASGRYQVRLQAPQEHLAPTESAFLLKPDITVISDGVPLMIMDTKWKDIGGGSPWSAIESGDAYQMTTYAMRYGCSTVTLIYPSMGDGREMASAKLSVPGAPKIRVCFVDIDKLALGGELPVALRPSSGLAQEYA